MRLFLALFILLWTRTVKSDTYGEYVNHYSYPYIAHLNFLRSGQSYSCTGSLILARWVLTSVSCLLYKAPRETVRVTFRFGPTNSFQTDSDLQIIHTGFFYMTRQKALLHDIALVRLNEPKLRPTENNFTKRCRECVTIVEVPNAENISVYLSNEDLAPGTSCFELGWAQQKSMDFNRFVLRKIDTVISDSDRCVQYYEKLVNLESVIVVKIISPKLETEIDDSGHSGGPLMCGGAQYGIVTTDYNLKMGNVETCESLVKVANYIQWIEEVINAYKN